MIIPQSIVASLTHDIFIKGCQVNYSLDKNTDVEVCSLYPDTPFRTMEECFDDFVTRINHVEAPKVVENPITSTKDAIISSKPESLAITAA